MHRLHTEYLVVALFVIEHRAREVVKYILCRQWAIRLKSSARRIQRMTHIPVSIRAK